MFKKFRWGELSLKVLSLLIGVSLGVRVLGVVYQSGFWFSGMVNDFILVKFGFTEVFSALAILVWVILGGKGIGWRDLVWGAVLILVVSMNVYFALDVYLALWKWVLVLLNLVTVRFILLDYWKSFVVGVLGVMLVNIVIGLLQIVFGRSLGLEFLGESKIGVEVWNVAKVSFGDLVLVRGYGLFEHANVFGYFCLIGFWLIDLVKVNFKRFWEILFKSFFLFGLVVSGSRLMFLALLLSFIYDFFRGRVRSFGGGILISVGVLFLLIFRGIGFGERGEFLVESLKMIGKFFNGVGLGNYLIGVLEFVDYRVDFWSLQFVHNVYLLIIAELGVFVGFGGVGFLLWKFFVWLRAGRFGEVGGRIMVGVLFVGLGEHLVWTNQRAFLLSLFLIAISLNEEKIFLDVRK